MAALFFVPIYFAWFHENFTVFDINKSVALRLLITISLSALLVWMAAGGYWLRCKSKMLRIVWSAVAGLFLLSSLLSLHPAISLLGSYERQQGFHNLIAYLLFFILIIFAFRERRDVEKAIIALQYSAAFVCIYGLLQVLGLDFLHWAESSIARIFSTLGQPNFLGHFLVVTLPLTLYAILFLYKRLVTKTLGILLFAAQLICLVFTYSRSAWLAFIISFLAAGLLALWHYKKRVLFFTVSITAIVIFVLLSLAPVRNFLLEKNGGDSLSIVYRVATAFDIREGTTATRLHYWSAGWRAFIEAPFSRQLIGFGPDVQATVYVQQYRTDWAYYERMNAFPDRAHNAPLDILLQFGWVGFGIFTIFVVLCVWPLWQTLRRAEGAHYWLGVSILIALVAYVVNNLFSFSLTAMSMILYSLLAMSYLYGHHYAVVEERPITFFQPFSRYILATGIITLLLVIFYAYNIRPIVADYYYMQVKKAEARNDCRKTLDNMEKVLSWYPTSPYYGRAYLHHSVNCFSAVTTPESQQQLINNIIDQSKQLPAQTSQFHTLTDLAHAYSILGYYADPDYYQQAELYYKKMIERGPYITTTLQDYGRMKLWQAKFAEARDIFNQGLAITPDPSRADPNTQRSQSILSQKAYFHILIGLSYNGEKKTAQAEQEFKTAITIDPLSTSSYKELADIAYQRKDVQSAITYNQAAFAVDPQNPLWPISLATLYLELRNTERAQHYVNQARALDPTDPRIKDLQARINNK